MHAGYREAPFEPAHARTLYAGDSEFKNPRLAGMFESTGSKCQTSEGVGIGDDRRGLDVLVPKCKRGDRVTSLVICGHSQPNATV